MYYYLVWVLIGWFDWLYLFWSVRVLTLLFCTHFPVLDARLRVLYLVWVLIGWFDWLYLCWLVAVLSLRCDLYAFSRWLDVLYFDWLASPVLINQKITLFSIWQHFKLKPLEPRPSPSFSEHNIFSSTVIWLPLIPQVTDSFSWESCKAVSFPSERLSSVLFKLCWNEERKDKSLLFSFCFVFIVLFWLTSWCCYWIKKVWFKMFSMPSFRCILSVKANTEGRHPPPPPPTHTHTHHPRERAIARSLQVCLDTTIIINTHL